VWGYGRDSGGETQDASVASQKAAYARYCETWGLLLVHVFADEARPGSSVVGRDAFEDMIHLAHQKPRPVDGILLWSFARFARDFDDAQFFKADLRRQGYVIISMTDHVPEGENGRLFEAIIDWKNEQFLKDLSQNVKRGLHDLVRQGYAPGGCPPKGYKAEKVTIGTRRNGEPRIVSRWVPDLDTWERARLAWEMRAQGASYQEIHEATRLYRSFNSYACMFRNKTYLGVLKCGDLEIEGAIEPLVTPDLWDAVQQTLRKRPKRGERWPEEKVHPKRMRSPFLLSGLARCGYCGSAMSGSHSNVGGNRGRRGGKPWRYYICGRKKRQGYHSCPGRQVKAERVEAAVLEVVLQRVLTPAFVGDLVAEVNAHLARDAPNLEAEIQAVQKELAEVRRAIDNLLDLAETFGAASAGARLLEREAERDRLCAQLRVLEARRDAARLIVTEEVILEVLGGMRDTLTGEYIQAKRVLLSKIVDHVDLEITHISRSPRYTQRT